jgi:uncharacterized protein YlxW (UPF0749 family)
MIAPDVPRRERESNMSSRVVAVVGADRIAKWRLVGVAATLGLLAGVIGVPAARIYAQAPQSGSAEERLKAVQEERDALRKQVDGLQARVSELQRTVDSLVRGVPRTPPNSVQEQIWRRMRAAQGENTPAPPEPQSQFGPVGIVPRGIYQRPQPESVALSVAFADAAAETVRAKSEFEAARRARPQGGEQAVRPEASNLQAAEQKLRMLRKVLTTIRDDYASENDRIRKLTQAGAVPTAYLHDRELQVKQLDAILAEDPEAPGKVNEPPKPGS